MGSRRSRSIVGAALLAALLGLVQAGPAAAKDGKPVSVEVDKSTILVKFREPATGNAKVRQKGDRSLGRTLTGVEVVQIQSGEKVAAKVDEYEARSDVLYAEPNVLRRLDVSSPNDLLFAQQWGLGAISAVAGWTIFPGVYGGSGGVPIAIVDSGVDAGHQDLAAKTLSASGASCYPSTCVAWPGAATDDNDHGTHVAGIAGAVTHNATGVAGVAFSSPLLPIKVCGSGGTCPDAAIVNGIAWARTHGAKVINLSLGGYGGSTTLCSAVSQALAAGVVVVAAAGNEGVSTPHYPSGCAGAIGVAATAPGDVSPTFSNFGYPNVFVSAPGVNVLSTVPGNGYLLFNGTSMASPHVAGLAALMLGQEPSRTPADVRRILAKTADKPTLYGSYTTNPFNACTGCTYHPYYGYGRIDVQAALSGALPKVTSFAPLSGAAGTLVTITGEELTDADSVTFGGVDAAFTVVSATKITATVPPGAVNGPIAVGTPGGTTTSATAFKVLPKIVTFAPASGVVGSLVTIQGSGFGGATQVKFGAVVATPVSVTPTQVTAGVPATALTGKLTVVTPSGSAVSATGFGVLPSISGLSPSTATAGQLVTVTGSTFAGTTSVKVNGVAATFSVLTGGSQLRLTVPAGATTGQVSVTNAGGTAVSPGVLSVLPKISSLSLLSGVAGTVVTVFGSGLELTSAVRFNGVAAGLGAGSTSTALKAVVPVLATNGPISVETSTGTAVSTSVFKVLPRITGFGPSTGVVGSSVTIYGSGFAGVGSVKLGAVAMSVSSSSVTEVTATVPPTGVTGKLTVVTPSGSAVSATGFGVLPSISGLSPSTATAGQLVTVTGSTFAGTTSVKVNGVAATFSVLTGGSQLRLTVPAGATTGQVSVTNAGGTAVSPGVLSVLPKISSLSLLSGVAGTVVTVFGSGLELTSAVRFNGVAAGLGAGSTSTALKAVVPVLATNGPISVETSTGTAVSTSVFKVLPRITGFGPSTGVVGSSVTIYGSGFAGVGSVKLGAVAMSVSSSSVTEVTATVPPTGVTGKLTVVTPSGSAVSATGFGVLPSISGLSPPAAASGELVTVSGSTFAGTTSVKVNGVAATFSVLTGGSQLRLTVPAGATSGPVTVTNAGGTATSADTLAVLPKAGSFWPSGGPTGTLVTINGTGFTSASTVTFSGAPAVPATYVSPTQVKAVVPAGAVTGKLRVTTPAGTSPPTAATFTVTLAVTGFVPAGGTPGTVVTVGGSGFVAPLTVKFGTAIGTGVVVDSPTQLHVTVPAGAQSGVVSVVRGAATVTGAGLFVVPRIMGFTPGSAAEGDPVAVSGADLVAPTFVLFGAAPASFTSGSTSQIVATVPAGLSGAVPITVTTLFGDVTSQGSFTPQP